MIQILRTIVATPIVFAAVFALYLGALIVGGRGYAVEVVGKLT